MVPLPGAQGSGAPIPPHAHTQMETHPHKHKAVCPPLLMESISSSHGAPGRRRECSLVHDSTLPPVTCNRKKETSQKKKGELHVESNV